MSTIAAIVRRASRRPLSLVSITRDIRRASIVAFLPSSSSSSASSSSLRQHLLLSPGPRIGHHCRLFSSLKKYGTEEQFLRVLESEIQCAESDDHEEIAETPRGFPFEIFDNPGEQTITLKRQYGGESIKVEVHMPEVDAGEIEKAATADDDDDDGDDRDDQNSAMMNVSLLIEVAKAEGPCLEFCCTALSNEITIDSMIIKNQAGSTERIPYNGPRFSDLDESLQKAFYKYLEMRGIRSSLTSFLHDYMINKDSREYLGWLKSMKEFIEK